MKHSAPAAALAAAALLALAGCGSNSATATSDPATTTAASSAAPASTTTAAPAPATSSAAPAPAPASPEITVAPGDPGVPPAAATQAETNFVETIEQGGVAITQDGSTEVNLGRALCTEIQTNPSADRQALITSLLAIGQFQQASGQSTLSPQQFAELLVATAENPANCNPG